MPSQRHNTLEGNGRDSEEARARAGLVNNWLPADRFQALIAELDFPQKVAELCDIYLIEQNGWAAGGADETPRFKAFKQKMRDGFQEHLAEQLYYATELLAFQVATNGRLSKRTLKTLFRLFFLREGTLNRDGRGRRLKIKTADVMKVLRERGFITRAATAEALDCDEGTVTAWAKSTEWGDWRKARVALLSQIKGKN